MRWRAGRMQLCLLGLLAAGLLVLTKVSWADAPLVAFGLAVAFVLVALWGVASRSLVLAWALGHSAVDEARAGARDLAARRWSRQDLRSARRAVRAGRPSADPDLAALEAVVATDLAERSWVWDGLAVSNGVVAAVLLHDEPTGLLGWFLAAMAGITFVQAVRDVTRSRRARAYLAAAGRARASGGDGPGLRPDAQP